MYSNVIFGVHYNTKYFEANYFKFYICLPIKSYYCTVYTVKYFFT